MKLVTLSSLAVHHDRKLDHVQSVPRRGRSQGATGVVAIVAAQEFQWSSAAKNRTGRAEAVSYDFVKEERRVGMLRLLHPRRRLRTRLHQDLHLLPLSGQGVAERARVGQAPGPPGKARFTSSPTALPPVATRSPAGHLRPLRTGRRPGLLRPLGSVIPTPFTDGRQAGRLLLGAVHAPGRGLAGHSSSTTPVGPGASSSPSSPTTSASAGPKRCGQSSPAR